MSEHEHTDDGIEDGIERDDLRRILSATMSAQDDIASAANQGVSFVDTRHPGPDIRRVHSDLLDAYGELCSAIDTAENTIRTSDWDHDVPRKITREHAERIKETYDRPIVDLALMLLEANRREWLHAKPEANGADAVRRHGLTANQRKFLNTLQRRERESDIDHEAVDEQLASLRADAAEVRGSGEWPDTSMADQIEEHVDDLEAALGGVEDGE